MSIFESNFSPLQVEALLCKPNKAKFVGFGSKSILDDVCSWLKGSGKNVRRSVVITFGNKPEIYQNSGKQAKKDDVIGGNDTFIGVESGH